MERNSSINDDKKNRASTEFWIDRILKMRLAVKVIYAFFVCNSRNNEMWFAQK